MRLSQARLPDTVDDWSIGLPGNVLRDLRRRWMAFDWLQFEQELNSFSQYRASIDGQTVHFLHVRSPEPDAMPILLTHGWPGSIVEFLDVVGPLSDPRRYGADSADAFHCVVPSIPGFAWSTPLAGDWDVPRIAHAWSALMAALGYRRYGVQGGDWGSAISRSVGAVDPNHVAGIHLNYLVTPIPADFSGEGAEADRAAKIQAYLAAPAGYMRVHSTTPQTLAYALTDSPIGLLGWLGEKFLRWADPRSPVPTDRILANTAIYWFTRTAGSAARLYAAGRGMRAGKTAGRPPTGVAVLPQDIVLPIRSLAEGAEHIVHWTEFEQGGHFAALEVPDAFVEDVRLFFRNCR